MLGAIACNLGHRRHCLFLYNLCMYVCMHACMYVCMYVYVYGYVCADVYVYLYAYICTRRKCVQLSSSSAIRN